MAEALKIYPSGFLGSISVDQTKPIDIATAARNLFKNGLDTKVSPYTANREVSDLFSDAANGAPEARTFEFKESVLKAALTAFGTNLFVDWIGAQYQSPGFNKWHSQWMDETIQYVLEGKPRNLSANNWCVLLKPGEQDNHPHQYSPTIRRIIFQEAGWDGIDRHTGTLQAPVVSKRSLQVGYLQMSVADFIITWCRREGGVGDLLDSLYVLFGKR